MSTVSVSATEFVSCFSSRQDTFRCPGEAEKCILEANTCDGVPHCPDGADERDCPVPGEENGGCGGHMDNCKLRRI